MSDSKLENSQSNYSLNTIENYDILIIYENSCDFNYLNSILKSTYNIFSATNLDETKEILNSFNKINLIIIDNSNFFEILNFIKQNQIYYDVPTIIIEDFEKSDLVTKALEIGAFDVWHKPTNPNLLLFRANGIVKRNSAIDQKTGLYSQETFITRSQNILDNNQDKSFYIIHFDIDNFKIYNHTYGIIDGDELLKFIGQECQNFVTNESIFCRWEKDHFVALIEERYLSSKNIIHYFMKLEQKFHPEYRFLLRMGLYKIENRDLSIIQMCDRALLAHESSKDGTQNRYAFYDERLLKNRVEEQEITDEMENALEKGQFEVYIQPQYNQINMHLYGAEALIRWNHPKRGLISPSFFIPIFERNGFISKIDRFVFRKVCELQRKWLDSGFNIVPISVNLSRAEAKNENLHNELLAILKEFHLSTKYINLEITESAYMDNPNQVINLTKNLQQAGFELEMDDFGSGYSSLNTLKEIPVDVLKLDFRFLYGNDESNRTTKILSSVIRMAHGMDMPIIAEGVETKEQADFLKSLGCFYIQGFYFDKPLPSNEFENRLIDFSPDFLKNTRFTNENYIPSILDVKSLLNDFVGAAAIIEFDGEKVEGIRFSNGFFELFNVTDIDYNLYQSDLRKGFTEDNYLIILNTIKKAIEIKEEVSCEVELLQLKGKNRPKWIRLKFRYLFHNEHVFTLHAKIENIEEEKNKDRIIQKLSDDIYALSDSLPGGTISFKYVDNNLSITHANEQMANMIGYSLVEYIEKMQKDIFSFIHEEDKIPVVDSVKSLFESSDKNYIEKDYRLYHKNGSIVYARFFSKVNTNIDGSRYATVIVLNFNGNKNLTKKISSLDKKNHSKINLTSKDFDDFLFTKGSFGFDFTQRILKFAIFKYNFFKDKFTSMTPSLHNLFGYTREEFYFKFNDSLKKLIWKEDIRELQKLENFENSENHDDIFLTHRVQTKEGSLKWVQCFGKIITQENGEQYYFGVMIDIDNRKKTEQKLLAQDFLIQTFENNIEGATVRYKITGKNWTVDYISENNYSLFGYSKEQLIELWKNNLFALIHPDDVEKVKTEMEKSINSDKISTQTIRLLKSDGTILWVKSNNKFYGNPKDGYFITTCYNITSQIEKENQLLQEKQRLNNLIDAIPGGIALYEIRPNMLKVLYVSQKVASMFGRTKEQFRLAIEEDEDLSILGQDSQKVKNAIKNLELTGKPFNVDFRVISKKDNQLIWANVSALQTSEHNGNPIFLAIYQNKTKTTNTLDSILSKTSFYILVFDVETNELLYVNIHAQKLIEKTFDEFNPVSVNEYLFGDKNKQFDIPFTSDFREDFYTKCVNKKDLLIKRFRIDWNGHDSIVIIAEEKTK